MNMGMNVRARLETGPSGGITRIETVVVAVVVFILASLAMDFFPHSRRGDEPAKPLSNLRPLGSGNLSYAVEGPNGAKGV